MSTTVIFDLSAPQLDLGCVLPRLRRCFAKRNAASIRSARVGPAPPGIAEQGPVFLGSAGSTAFLPGWSD
jgi:hypothetical protein